MERMVCDENKKLKPYSVETNNCQTFVNEFLEKVGLGNKDLFFRENEWNESLKKAPKVYTKERIKSDFHHDRKGFISEKELEHSLSE